MSKILIRRTRYNSKACSSTCGSLCLASPSIEWCTLSRIGTCSPQIPTSGKSTTILKLTEGSFDDDDDVANVCLNFSFIFSSRSPTSGSRCKDTILQSARLRIDLASDSVMSRPEIARGAGYDALEGPRRTDSRAWISSS
jgi:hypothetical protein